MSIKSDLEMFKIYLEDERVRLPKIENDDFLKEILTRRCESYERLISELESKELEDGQASISRVL